jgi:predicted  nucleic acid-binding Zn-ribbon protein
MKALNIRKLFRSGPTIEGEEIIFSPGVNVIVGRPNTGKTKWLQMLDYTFGSEKQPKEVFGDDLALKYDYLRVILDIGGVESTVERRWKEAGTKGKILIDGTPYSPPDFCAKVLQLLDIPSLHYPQGDPYGIRTWPELSLRGLLRHIYRRQRFWSDLADMQPTSEQHACILQFLGVAEHLFSDDYGTLVKRKKEIWELQTKKEQFLSMLHEVSRDLLDEDDRGLILTSESIAAALKRVRDELQRIEGDKKTALSQLLTDTQSLPGGKTDNEPSLFEQQSERLAQIQAKAESIRHARAATEIRLQEMESYKVNVAQEMGRLLRAQIAGDTLANLKVTHCPACDRQITQHTHENGNCYVCGREHLDGAGDGSRRIAFEMEHLQAEEEEAKELIGNLRSEIASYNTMEKSLSAELRKVESLLRPVRQAAAAILPPEFALLDTQAGQVQERLAQLERIRDTFAKREELNDKIHTIEKTLVELEAKVERQGILAGVEGAGDWLAEGMTDYCNALNRLQAHAWPHERINIRLSERRFDIRVGSGRWQAKLGGTLTLYFLIAYQYGLLRLISRSECHFPGLVILDFPAVLEDGSSVHDKENYVVEPFVELLAKPEYSHGQVIAVGSSFEHLAGANRIELSHVWTEGGEGEEVLEVPTFEDPQNGEQEDS